MELLLPLVAFVLLILSILVLLAICDADLTTLFYEKFGKKAEVLRGQVIWVTGASSGIGEALCVKLASHGARLVLSARRTELLEEVKKKCLSEGMKHFKDYSEEDVFVVPMDMTDMQSHSRCFQEVIHHFGKLDVLVNNAGRSQRAHWGKIDLDVDREMFELNVFGAVNLTRAVLPHFKDHHKGHVVVMSSVAGKVPAPFSASYTASKHALHGYFGTLKIEKAMENIAVTLICPGPVFSSLLQEAYTENIGKKFGEQMNPTDKRMSTKRCAYLCTIAIANQLSEVWMATFPILLAVYIIHYCPSIGTLLVKILGKKAIMKLRDSRDIMQQENKDE